MLFCCCIACSSQAWADNIEAEGSCHQRAVRSCQSNYTCSTVPGTQVSGFLSEARNVETWLLPDPAWELVEHPVGRKLPLLSTVRSSWVLWVMFWSPSFTWVYLINNRSRLKSEPLFSPAKTRALQFLMQITLRHYCFNSSCQKDISSLGCRGAELGRLI